MGTRDMGYRNYGFGDGEEKRLKEYCRRDGFTEHEILLQSAISSNAAIAGDLFYSLIYGVSYDRLSRARYIPYGKGDFYAYQRKCLSIFRNFLLLYGKWE